MYSDLESNESKRREVVSSLYWSLMQGWNIPLSIQDYYGLTEDYRLFHQLEGMAPDEYLRKRQTGEVPDILEVDARLTHAVEKIFESVCPRPPAEYLDKLNGELERLGTSDSSKTRHSFPQVRLTKRIRPFFSLPSMEVETTRKVPSGTWSRSLRFCIVRNRSLFTVRNGTQVILVAMAGASMMTFLALRNLSRYFAL